jgi:hypothetical protein
MIVHNIIIMGLATNLLLLIVTLGSGYILGLSHITYYITELHMGRYTVFEELQRELLIACGPDYQQYTGCKDIKLHLDDIEQHYHVFTESFQNIEKGWSHLTKTCHGITNHSAPLLCIHKLRLVDRITINNSTEWHNREL